MSAKNYQNINNAKHYKKIRFKYGSVKRIIFLIISYSIKENFLFAVLRYWRAIFNLGSLFFTKFSNYRTDCIEYTEEDYCDSDC